VLSSPESAAARRPGLGLFPFLLAALAAIVVAALAWGEDLLVSPPVPPNAAERAVAAFVGASPTRVFLTERESRLAAGRGLMPSGTRSVIGTRGALDFGEWRWDEQGVPPGPISVRVDLGRQLVSVFRGPDEIGTAVIVYGVDGKETPRGKLPVLGKSRDYHSITYDAPMPYSLWLRGDGVALHGSTVSMGKATNGCIGVPVEFAGKLFALAGKGDIVEVVG
jgi:hypothetical protein